MTPWPALTLFFAIVLVSHVLEGITGFGSTALSIPFLSVLLGVEVAKPILILYTPLLCLYVLARGWRQVAWRQFAVMAGVAALGLPLGLLLYSRLPRRALLALLGLFMVAVSLRGLLSAVGLLGAKRAPKTGFLLGGLFCGGVIQGAFASGGPLIILYATEKIPDKGAFRATMCMVWLALNSVLLAQAGFAGQLTAEVWRLALWGFPFLLAGTLLGDFFHKRVSQALFTKLVYAALLVSGVFVFFNL